MSLGVGEPVDSRLPWVRRVSRLDSAWGTAHAGDRVVALREGGEALGDALRSDAKVVSVRT